MNRSETIATLLMTFILLLLFAAFGPVPTPLAGALVLEQFTTSQITENITIGVSGYNDSINISLPSNATIGYASFNLTGYNLTNYPENVSFDLGSDGDIEWTQTGVLNTTVAISDFTQNLTALLSACSCPGCNSTAAPGNCTIDLNFTSDTQSGMLIQNLNITYSEPLNGINCTPPPIGDWNIDDNENVLCQQGTFDSDNLGGNIIVNDNANVTLFGIELVSPKSLTLRGNATLVLQALSEINKLLVISENDTIFSLHNLTNTMSTQRSYQSSNTNLTLNITPTPVIFSWEFLAKDNSTNSVVDSILDKVTLQGNSTNTISNSTITQLDILENSTNTLYNITVTDAFISGTTHTNNSYSSITNLNIETSDNVSIDSFYPQANLTTLIQGVQRFYLNFTNLTFSNLNLSLTDQSHSTLTNVTTNNTYFKDNTTTEIKESVLDSVRLLNNSILNFTEPQSKLQSFAQLFGNLTIYGYVDMPESLGISVYNATVSRFYPISIKNYLNATIPNEVIELRNSTNTSHIIYSEISSALGNIFNVTFSSDDISQVYDLFTFSEVEPTTLTLLTDTEIVKYITTFNNNLTHAYIQFPPNSNTSFSIVLPKDFVVTNAKVNLTGTQPGFSYPHDITININNDSDVEYTYAGALSTTVEASLSGAEIQEFLDNNTLCPSGICYVPLNISSSTQGGLNLTHLRIGEDVTSPSISITFPTDNLYTTDNTLSANFTWSDDVSSYVNYTIYVNDVVNATGTATTSPVSRALSALADQNTYDLKVDIIDRAENTNSDSVTFTIDNVDPSQSTLSISEDDCDILLSFSASDDFGIQNYQIFRATRSDDQDLNNPRIETSSTSALDSGSDSVTYYYKVRAIDRAGNIGPLSNETSVEASCPIESTDGGGGGGTSSLGLTTALATTKNIFASIIPGELNTVTIASTVIPITYFDFILNTAVTNARFETSKLSAKPTTITPTPTGKVFSYVEIRHFINEALFNSATIRFFVEQTWILNNNIDKNKVSLQRFSGTSWVKLPTVKLSEDAERVFYSATAPALSFFAITGESAAPTTPTAVCGNGFCESGETAITCPQDCVSAPRAICGNGVCESGETHLTCSADCLPPTPTSVCGNNVCEEGEPEICPEDCPKEFQVGFLIILFLLAGVAGGGFFVYKKYLRPKPLRPSALTAVSARVAPTDPVVSYIQRTRSQGFTDEQIRKNLTSAGWPSKRVEGTLARLGPSLVIKPTAPTISPTEYEANKQDILAFLEVAQNRGLTIDQIRLELEGKGWNKKLIEKILKEEHLI